MSVFNPEQLQELALVSLQLHGQGYHLTLVFFGFSSLLLGYLMYRSIFLPRIFGVLLTVAGSGYLIMGFANFIAPAFRARISLLLLPSGIAELLLTLWLLVVGVNAQRWKEQAGRAGVGD